MFTKSGPHLSKRSRIALCGWQPDIGNAGRTDVLKISAFSEFLALRVDTKGLQFVPPIDGRMDCFLRKIIICFWFASS